MVVTASEGGTAETVLVSMEITSLSPGKRYCCGVCERSPMIYGAVIVALNVIAGKKCVSETPW